MRNLKKILALVLAMVMAFSVMATANAALTDLDSVDASYDEAVEVLTGMGVFKGRTAADGSTYFAPDASITRQEVAAIMYRIASADVADKQNALYVEGADFSDVKSTDWAAGYIGYCANGGLVQGYAGKFNPTDDVTGYQVLAMALRAIGYDANGEFTGADWQKNVATTAQALNLLVNVDGSVQLSKPASRELVAELIFRTIAYAEQVEYTNAFGYQPIKIWNAPTTTLGYEQFKLTGVDYRDAWGRPGTRWFSDKNTNKVYNSNVDTLYATVMADYIAAYNVATSECDIATAAGVTTSKDYTVYTNGIDNAVVKTIRATATTSKLGAQGTQIELYKNDIVIIDTYLAKVTKVVAATFDAAGHLKTSSQLHLDVYNADNATTKNGAAQSVVLFGGKTNYEYAKGQMLLVNAVADANGKIALTAGTYGTTPSTLKIVGVAEPMVGAQTVLWWNVAQHTVEGTTYNDAVRFYLDEAGSDIGAHAWYFDQFDNLIGVTDVATQYTYGVISNLWWAGDASTGTGVAKATLTYMDGTTATVNLASVDVDGITLYNNDGTVKSGATLGHKPVYSTDVLNVMGQIVAPTTTANGTFGVSTNALTNITTANNEVIAQHLFQFVTLADGSVVAYKVQEEVTNATVAKGVSAITGTNGPVYTNSDTMYLVRTGTAANGYIYTPVTDYNMIGNYTAATVDYVDTDADIYAEYVYLYGTALDNTADFVFANGNNYGAHLYTSANGISYYEFTYGVKADGTANVIKVANESYTVNGTTYNGKANVIDVLTAGVGKLFKLTYVNGLAVTATEVTAAGQVANNETAVYLGNDVTANANVLYDANGLAYNITNSTVVIGGTLADLASAGKSVYVVYPTPAVGVNPNYVTYIYITNVVAPQIQMDAAAAKAAALTLADISGTEITEASLEAAVKAAIEAAIGNSNITVLTDVVAGDVPAADGVKHAVTVYYALYLDGATAVTGVTKTVNVTHVANSADLVPGINAQIAANVATLKAQASFEDCAALIKGTIDSTLSVTSTVTITSSTGKWESGAQMTVSYSFLYNGATVSGTTTFTK